MLYYRERSCNCKVQSFSMYNNGIITGLKFVHLLALERILMHSDGFAMSICKVLGYSLHCIEDDVEKK